MKQNVKSIFRLNNRELAIFFVLIIIMLVFSFYDLRYLEAGNLIDIIEQSIINGLLAIGTTFVIITGGIDLSVGSIMAVAIVACGKMAVNGMNSFLVVLVGLLIGCIVGIINGILVTKMKLQPFISTLGTNSALRGVAYLVSGGWPVLNIPKGFRNLFQIEILYNMPISIAILLVVALICSFILKNTPSGIYIYAIGSNEEATKLSGVNTDRHKIFAYSICGMTAALAGMIMLARLGTGEPTAGQGYELNAIAAAAIGGASLAGGKGSILGTLLGALTLSALKAGLVIIGMDTFYQYIATGLIIVIAAYFEVIQSSIKSYFSRHSKTVLNEPEIGK